MGIGDLTRSAGLCIFALTVKPHLFSQPPWRNKLLPLKIAVVITLEDAWPAFPINIEYIPLRLAVFSLYLLIFVKTMKDKYPNPWLIFSSTYFMLGLLHSFPSCCFRIHISTVGQKRHNRKKNITNWTVACCRLRLLPFVRWLHFTVGLNASFVLQIVSGHESLTYSSGNNCRERKRNIFNTTWLIL